VIGLARAPCDEGVVRAGAAVGCAEAAKPWVLAATILGSSMAFIDGSVVGVALPAIQADLGASVRAAQWVANAYMLTLGALILAGGAAGDRFGRRRVFALGVAVFTLASIACGLAPDGGALIAARAVQGVGGAMLVPGSLAIISASFPENERGRAIGAWAGFSALTTALGPVLGGWLVDAFSWRAIFFVNVPIGVAAVLLALWRVPESRDEAAGAVDWRGAILATVALGEFAYGLTEASDRSRGDVTAISLIAGVGALGGFVWLERRAPSPMLPAELFRSRPFSGANVITLLLYFALGGAMFFLPFNLIRIQGYSATMAGAAFLPFTLIMGGLSRWSGGLIDRYGARMPLTIGPIIVAAGFGLLAAPGIGGPYWTTFFPGMVVLGLGMAVSVAPLTTAVMGAVEARHAGLASGINNAAARIAGLMAVALLGAVAVGLFTGILEHRLAELSLPPELRRAMLAQAPRLAEAEPPTIAGEALRPLMAQALRGAFVASFRVIMLIAAGLALLASLCAHLSIARISKVERAPATA
jgi:EmrB/QacA subfamily drug resistance transporter